MLCQPAGLTRLRLALLLLVLPSIYSHPLVAAQNAAEQTFVSSGKTIHFERYAPADSSKHPVVFVLYGASGLTDGNDTLRDYARDLSQHGYIAIILHYFDATDSASAGALPVPRERFQRWTNTLQDAITYVLRDPVVDRRRVGMVAFSLGAFLGLWEASQDPRVTAVSEYYGGTAMFLGPPQRMPATLILHGEKDSFVPVEEARKVQRIVEQEHAACEIKIYPGQEHGFDGPEGDPVVKQDAWERTLRFFQKHLTH